MQTEDAKFGVWNEDNVSPASHLFSYRCAAPYLLWQPQATSLWVNTLGLGLVTLGDASILKISNQFIAHHSSNSEASRIRSFTMDTIPISIPVNNEKVLLQLLLSKTYQMLEQASSSASTDAEEQQPVTLAELFSCD